VRADSAFYSKMVLATAAKFDVRFSITARQDKRVRAAIDTIPDEAWQPIPYWLSTPEVSGADIAEVAFNVSAYDLTCWFRYDLTCRSSACGSWHGRPSVR
jgi:hypothetical protein